MKLLKWIPSSPNAYNYPLFLEVHKYHKNFLIYIPFIFLALVASNIKPRTKLGRVPMFDIKPSIIIIIICASLLALVVILCCLCIIRGRKKKDSTRPTPSGSISSRPPPPPWPRQSYYDVEFGQGVRAYRQDTLRSEQSVPSDRHGAQRSEQYSFRTDRSRSSQSSEPSVGRDKRSGFKDGGMAILAGAGAAMAAAAAALGLSSGGGQEYGGNGDGYWGDGSRTDGYGDSWGNGNRDGGSVGGGVCGAGCGSVGGGVCGAGCGSVGGSACGSSGGNNYSQH